MRHKAAGAWFTSDLRTAIFPNQATMRAMPTSAGGGLVE